MASEQARPQSTSPAQTFELPPSVYSPQMLESVKYEIQEYLDWYRQTRIQKEVGAQGQLKPEPTHSAETNKVIEVWLAGKKPTLESLEQLVEHLDKLNLPEVHIMLAALPNRAQREALVTWFRNNAHQHLLLSFVADRNLGGGIVVRTPNRVFDFSWKQQLVNGREKIAEILKRV
jgi:ATP synthase delta (OSCP) subunit